MEDTMIADERTPRASAAQILVVVAAFVVVVAGMRASVSILVPFLLAAFIAIIGSPPLFWLKQKGVPSGLSLLIVILGIVCIGLMVGWMLGSSLKAFTEDLPAYDAKLQHQIAAFTAWLGSKGVDTSGLELNEIFNPGSVMRFAGSLLSGLRKMLTDSFLILMTVIFMLAEASSLPAKLMAIMGGKKKAMRNFDRFIDTVKDYMAIKTLVSLGTGVVVAVWVAVMGVSYPILWGFLAFLLNFIPNIGSIIAALPAVVLAFIQLGPIKALIVAAGYFVINVVMGSVIEPRFMGKSLGLSTLVVFFSLIFWGWVLGPVGMLLSVPLTITAKIALDTREDARWLSLLLGPGPGLKKPLKKK